MAIPAPLLSLTGVSKSFGANKVLKDVSFTVSSGEVLCLVGENGAGKSTLMHIIAGTFSSDGGSIRFRGADYRPSSPKAARAAGVALALQETAILPDLSVAENVFFGSEPRNSFGLIDQVRLHEEARELFLDLGFALQPDLLGGSLTAAERQMAEIAKAYRLDPSVLILDEPTASLSAHEAALVLEVMRRITQRGGAAIFISHRLDEIIVAADRAVVLKDGVLTLDASRGQFDRDDLVKAMVGRTLSDIFPPRPEVVTGIPVFAVSAGEAPGLKPIDFDVRAGEIVGFAGLDGQGQRPLARALSGAAPFVRGSVSVHGRPLQLRDPATAIKVGIASIPDDRKHEGLALDLSIKMNVSYFALLRRTRWAALPIRLEQAFANDARQRFAIRSTGIEQTVRQLSGGNQQKVVFARWLADIPKLLVLYEPTKGVDVGAKTEIYRLIGELASKGVAVVLISSDMLELIGLCDRINVLFEGAIQGRLPRSEFSEEAIMLLASGPSEQGATHVVA